MPTSRPESKSPLGARGQSMKNLQITVRQRKSSVSRCSKSSHSSLNLPNAADRRGCLNKTCEELYGALRTPANQL